MRRSLELLVSIGLCAGCVAYEPPQGVRQHDLDAWVGIPVIALETHSFFVPLPLVKTRTSDGLEIWHYANRQGISSCTANMASSGSSVNYKTYVSYQQCTSGLYGCDSIFYIREGRVLQYKTSGSCYTTEMHQPEPGWQQLQRRR